MHGLQIIILICKNIYNKLKLVTVDSLTLTNLLHDYTHAIICDTKIII